MDKEWLLDTCKQTFLELLENSFNSGADEESIELGAVFRISQAQIKYCKINPVTAELTHLSSLTDPQIDFELYLHQFANKDDLEYIIKQLAFSFPDLSGGSYKFEMIENIEQEISKWGSIYISFMKYLPIDASKINSMISIYCDSMSALYFVVLPNIHITLLFNRFFDPIE